MIAESHEIVRDNMMHVALLLFVRAAKWPLKTSDLLTLGLAPHIILSMKFTERWSDISLESFIMKFNWMF